MRKIDENSRNVFVWTMAGDSEGSLEFAQTLTVRVASMGDTQFISTVLCVTTFVIILRRVHAISASSAGKSPW